MHPLYRSRYDEWLRQAEVERLILDAPRHKPQRAWALRLGRGIVRLGQRVERFGKPGIGSHHHLLHSSK